jgi:hypothetical protein
MGYWDVLEWVEKLSSPEGKWLSRKDIIAVSGMPDKQTGNAIRKLIQKGMVAWTQGPRHMYLVRPLPKGSTARARAAGVQEKEVEILVGI